MPNTVISVFSSPYDAMQAIDQLVKAGIGRREIEIIPNVPTEQRPRGAETADVLGHDELVQALIGSGIAAEEARRLDDAVREGAVLVKVTADGQITDRASGLLQTSWTQLGVPVATHTPG